MLQTKRKSSKLGKHENKFKQNEETDKQTSTQPNYQTETQLEENITIAEVRAAVKSLKLGKAEGIDEIKAEFIKYGGGSN